MLSGKLEWRTAAGDQRVVYRLYPNYGGEQRPLAFFKAAPSSTVSALNYYSWCLREPFRMQGIEARSAVCKAQALQPFLPSVVEHEEPTRLVKHILSFSGLYQSASQDLH